jgi:predicted signal transduction protein with EAL and GGDEF domain
VGGDQFALLVHRAEQRSAEAAAARVLDAVGRAYAFEGSQFTLTCSIGIALYPSDGNDGNELMRHAETAMHRAKQGGRAAFRFHQPSHDADLRSRMQLDHAMRQALTAQRFRLAYQPQVQVDGDAIVGAEALARWRDPELGEVAPAQFIAVAEESGFIIALGDWVLTQAVRQAAAWRSRGMPLKVAVNVSALQFQQADFVDRVAAVEGLGRTVKLMLPGNFEDKLIVWTLVMLLDDDELKVRETAFASMKDWVKETYDYKPDLPTAERKASVAKWKNWCAKVAGTLEGKP